MQRRLNMPIQRKLMEGDVTGKSGLCTQPLKGRLDQSFDQVRASPPLRQSSRSIVCGAPVGPSARQ